jgi:hypothetical protein
MQDFATSFKHWQSIASSSGKCYRSKVGGYIVQLAETERIGGPFPAQLPGIERMASHGGPSF